MPTVVNPFPTMINKISNTTNHADVEESPLGFFFLTPANRTDDN